MSKRIVRGLDLQKSGDFSDEEVQRTHEFYKKTLGHTHAGLDFWIDHGPDHLRRFRLFSDAATPNQYESNKRVFGFGFLAYYALIGYDVGVRYLLTTRQRMGLTKSQIEEGIAMAFLAGGPAGMETIARALADFEWIVPAEPAVFPDDWAPDAAAFSSGLDFSSEELTKAELRTLEEWYASVLGEVPAYVRFLGRERPNMLKAMRNRWEHCLVELPKQFMPTTMLHFEVTRGWKPGIRENVQLARAFGVSKSMVLTVIGSALINGWTSGASLIDEAAGDVFEAWDA